MRREFRWAALCHSAPRFRAAGVAVAALITAIASPGVSQAKPQEAFLAELVAQSFFRGLLEGRLQVIEPLLAKRVRVEGRWVDGRKLRPFLQRLIRRARRRGLKLRKLVMLDYPQMVRRFGPPPKRLSVALKPSDQIALARFGQLGAVVALRRQGRFFRIHLITD